MTVQYNNLSGVIVNKEDGNLAPEAAKLGPRVAIIGTAGQGMGSTPFAVQTTSLAKAEFGTEGNLIRGMWEAKAAGAQDLYLYRIGAEAAKVTGIGDATGALGFTVETVEQDASAGDNYAISYNATTNRLIVKRNFDDLIVYDNDPAAPINKYEVIVSGYRATGPQQDIGTSSSYEDMSDCQAIVPGVAYTAGSDGLSLSRMKMYEKLQVAYEHLKEYGFDVVVPMDVYLDDYNTVDQGHYLGAVAPASGGNVYPTPGSFLLGTDVDALGMVYMEEYEGQMYFWWRFGNPGSTPNVADIFPVGVGVAPGSSNSRTASGKTLTADDFHEVNFAYQLAKFLHEYSTNIVDATGVIGVLPPASESLVDRARWLGKSPSWSFNTSTGAYYIAVPGDNGTGLLGNKFMVGQANYRQGVFGGGFIMTDGSYLDEGEEEIDTNDIPVDLGKYLSIVTDYPLLKNSFNTLGYIASYAASYAGFYVNMSPSSAPTNKKVTNAQIIYRQKLGNLDALAGNGYVVLRNKPQGLVVGDAPTASMPESDWRRLSTVRIVKSVVDAVREAVDPFLGESLSQGKKAALQTAIEKVLMNAKKSGILTDYRSFEVIQTPQMAVAGRADVNLVLIPAFELRQVVITVSVAKS